MRGPVINARGPGSASNLVRGGASPSDLSIVQRILFESPWRVAILLLRMLYGFQVEGADNLPKKGPFILVSNEHSPIAFLITGWVAITALKQAFRSNPETISFLREELFDFPFFRSALNEKTPGRYAALTPVAAGRLALGLLEAHRVLESGGIVVLNPEGDMPWDGRPLPIGHGLAWLGLHTATPIVPAMITAGAYDIWPRWQARMNLRGRVRLRIGEPFRLCDSPQPRVTDTEIKNAEETMRTRFDSLIYGPGGKSEWFGLATRNGIPQSEALVIRSPKLAPPDDGAKPRQIAPWRRGLALLLWRCPVCQQDDSLVHERPFLRAQKLSCRTCGTGWSIRHVPGSDFRLKVLQGPAELVGVEMALTAWYDETRRQFVDTPSSRANEGPHEEQVIAQSDGVSLLPRQPNTLIDSWNGREPPVTQPRFTPRLGGWEKIGKGTLVLTEERLIWKGPRGELDFWWRNVTSVSLWMVNTLTIRYGVAPYRFELGKENGLKWLTYSGFQARRASAKTKRKLDISPF